MKIIKRDPAKVLKGFLNRIENEVYSEPDSNLHIELTNKMLPAFVKFIPDPQTRILDVGCGQGYACLKFKELGYQHITGISLSDEDVEATRRKGIACHKMDMTFLQYDNQTFDALWVRHSLEHSPFPYLTLLEFNRVLVVGGFIYIEMPMPDTPRVLEHWQNHYSIFGKKMWLSLFDRSGFEALVKTDIGFPLQRDDFNDGKPFEQSNHVFVLRKIGDEIIP